MFTPTVVTDRPIELGLSQLLMAGNGDDLGHLLATDEVTDLTFRFTPVMAIDVRSLLSLQRLYRPRTGKITLVFGRGADDTRDMRGLADSTSGHADLDDPGQAAALRTLVATLGGRTLDGGRTALVNPDTVRVLTHA